MNSEDKVNSKFAEFLRKAALDELPQIINILKGEMSFVGSRPLIPQETNYELSIKPGLTGIAQISISKDASSQEKSKYNNWYIKNQSPFLDIRIIILSFLKSFKLSWDR
jgi:lipopolysaccharide/colanic/teichoic acid biosynthesis glycosyltransferase